MKLADDVDAPFKLYAEDPQSNEISDVELFRTMKQRNPEMFTQLKENVNQGLRMAKAKPVFCEICDTDINKIPGRVSGKIGQLPVAFCGICITGIVNMLMEYQNGKKKHT